MANFLDNQVDANTETMCNFVAKYNALIEELQTESDGFNDTLQGLTALIANFVSKNGSLVNSGFFLQLNDANNDSNARESFYSSSIEWNVIYDDGVNNAESFMTLSANDGLVVNNKARYFNLPSYNSIDEKGFVPKKYVDTLYQQLDDLNGTYDLLNSPRNLHANIDLLLGNSTLNMLPALSQEGSYVQVLLQDSAGYDLTFVHNQYFFRLSQNFSIPVSAVTSNSFTVRVPAGQVAVFAFSFSEFILVNGSYYNVPIVTI
jgi:hypothetical protein